MAAVGVLIDTDVFIDYFNTGRHASILEDPTRRIYYSIVTRKELLAKEGLRDSERQAIVETLRGFRLVPINRAIAGRYSRVRTAATRCAAWPETGQRRRSVRLPAARR